MDFNQSLTQKQKQTLKLSPQMIQSLKLLTLPAAELREYIYQEVENNPALELKEPKEKFNELPETQTEKFSAKRGTVADSDNYMSFIESLPDNSETLQQHLLDQLFEIPLNEDEKEIAEKIIQNLDEKGFNIVPFSELFNDFAKNKRIGKVISIVRALEPVGTACDGIQESLLVQAKLYEKAPKLAVEILKNHFEILENTRISAVYAKFPQWNQKEIENALEFIRSLEPYPGRQFSAQKTRYIMPDVYVTRTETDSDDLEDHFIVSLSKEDLPVPFISPFFKKLQQKNKSGNEAQAFVKDYINDAEWFLNSLEYRNTVLLKTVRAIIRKQKAFFLGISSTPVPLTMKEIANEVEVHEATISRIANSKYLQCEKGLFGLRYFFVAAAVKSEEQSFSKEAVKQKIKQILSESDKEKKKLSDEKIAGLLSEYGMSISRRTVAKYRTELGIESSYDR